MARTLSQRAREKAIAASQELVATKGIAGFSIDSVARLSGVAKTTLYRHWPSASELLVCSLDCQVTKLSTPNTGSLRDDLHNILAQAMPTLNDVGMRRMMLDVLSAAAHDADLAAVHHTMLDERRRPIATVLELAIARGEIPPVDVGLAIDMVEGPFLTRVLLSDSPIDKQDMTEILEFTLRGLGLRPDTSTDSRP